MTDPNEAPAELIRRAATLMRQRAEAASPGPWQEMCMGSEGCSVLNDGRLRDRKHVSFSGRKEWKADHADAEHVAGMDPFVALAVAGWLDTFEGRLCDQDFAVPDWNAALAIARAYLGEAAS
jgi:hypothetical protein